MPFIIAKERALYWAVGEPVVAAGLTEVGGATLTGLTLFSAADENEFLGKVAGKATGYTSLPAVGEWLEAGDIYAYEGGLVIVRQAHSRTIYAPEDTPALFSVYREDATDALGWVANERVEVGMRRTDEGLTYQCLQSHVTQVDWRPSVTPALWKLVEDESDCPEFVQPTGAHDAYNIGDCVTFEGQQYVSKINANVWSPAVYPAGWELQ
jgi:hypothetical protein